jgi:hypothetical protein
MESCITCRRLVEAIKSYRGSNEKVDKELKKNGTKGLLFSYY